MRWLLLAVALCTYVAAAIVIASSQQALDPRPVIAICAYSASPPVVTSGQFVLVQCNSTGGI